MKIKEKMVPCKVPCKAPGSVYGPLGEMAPHADGAFAPATLLVRAADAVKIGELAMARVLALDAAWLLEQHIALRSESKEDWLRDVLLRGYVSCPGDEWEHVISTSSLMKSYVNFCVAFDIHHVKTQRHFESLLLRMFTKTTVYERGRKRHGYALGSLCDARMRFDRYHGTTTPWPEDPDWLS